MKAVNALFLTLMLAAGLGSCASIGLAPAQSFDQKLAYAYGTHTAVLQAAASAVAAGTISQTEGHTVLSLADQARTLLDSARALESTNADKASQNLALAAAVLSQLQSYLQARGVK